MKKIVFLLVSLLLLSSAAPISADNARTSGPYTYEIKGNGTITITDFDWSKNEADVFIPNMIDGYTVTGIGDGAFAYGDIEDSYSAYSRQPKHYAVTLQDGITAIGDKAFWNADISEINIPSSVQSIGAGAFYGCPSCQFKVAPNHSNFAVIDEGLYDKSKKELLALSWKNIPFDSTKRNVTIPEGIRSVGAYSFASAYLGRGIITLPSTLTTIDDYAFWNALGVLSGDLSNLTTIGVGAFMKSDCIEEDLTLPSIESIGEMAFQEAHIDAYLKFTNAPIKQLKDKTFQNVHVSYKNSISFKGCSLEQIGNEVYNEKNLSIFIDVKNCKDIGRGNAGIGYWMIDENYFSPFLTTIPAGLNPYFKSLPPTVTAIESGAYTDVVSDFRLSTSLEDIAVDAFPKGSTFIVDAGSYAELWCSENGFGYSIEGQNSLDWLNN